MTFLPEYPSLSALEITAKPEARRAKSQRKFAAERQQVALTSMWDEVIGAAGNFTHASHENVHEWMGAWSMTSRFQTEPNPTLLSAAFVGVTKSVHMPSSSSVRAGAPYIEITSRFIDLCARITELFVPFINCVYKRVDVEGMAQARGVLFEHLDPATPDPALSTELHECRDALLTTRTIAAAIRWAIAHEMAHISVGREGRQTAYRQVNTIWPNLEMDQWLPKKPQLRDFENSLKSYRDEIACDVLAIDFVLASPFATDDLLTQVCGALVALEAIRWDGWFLDESALSPTHPSPTLRLHLVREAWLRRLQDEQTWVGRRRPEFWDLRDVAFWTAFNHWASGEYRQERRGEAWNDDFEKTLTRLTDPPGELAPDQLYGLVNERIVRLDRKRASPSG